MLNFLSHNIQLVVVLVVLSFSAIGFVFRKLKEYKLQRQHQQNTRLAEIERLRTGRGPEGVEAPPPGRPINAQQARAAEIAARRQAQLDELRRRRQQGGTIEPIPGVVLRIPGSTGPTVPGTRPPTAPVGVSGTGIGAEAAAIERRREIEEKRRLAQQRQRDLQLRQQEEIDRQRAAQDRQRAAKKARQQPAPEPGQRAGSPEPRPEPQKARSAAGARGDIGGSPWDRDAETGESTTHRVVSDAKGSPTSRPRATSPLFALAGTQDWKRAVILQEILGKPVGERDM